MPISATGATDLVDGTSVLRIAICLLLVAGIARAEAPTFAIDLRGKEALADKMAASLEEAFRKLGSAKSADYRSKGTKKDRVAASTEACPNAMTAACAAVIGGKLGVEFVFAGHVETRNKKFLLELDMFSVRSGKRVRSLRDYAPSTVDPKKWALAVFTKLVETSTGSLQISSNAQHGEVFVDGQRVAELYQGRAMVSGLVLGMHKLELRAAGFKPYVDDVTVDGTTPVNVLLQP